MDEKAQASLRKSWEKRICLNLKNIAEKIRIRCMTERQISLYT